MSNIEGNSIFWIDVDKIHPNPYQPRREFDEKALKDLSESIRMYGVLQPLVVTRREVQKPDGGLATEYELISGERRTRAARLAGVREVPAIIRTDADDARLKLELAIIENLQREDLNPVERAQSFMRLHKEFGLTHAQIGAKVGKSREFVSNTLRILALPQEMIQALSEGKITEGHTRPLLMLADRPDEQMTLFKEVMLRRLTVRETEASARKIAVDKVRKVDKRIDPELVELESKASEVLGTRVSIDHKKEGGKIIISFFGDEDLKHLLAAIASKQPLNVEKAEAAAEAKREETAAVTESGTPVDDRSAEEKEQADEDLYSLKNFSL